MTARLTLAVAVAVVAAVAVAVGHARPDRDVARDARRWNLR